MTKADIILAIGWWMPALDADKLRWLLWLCRHMAERSIIRGTAPQPKAEYE